jgi:AhpD family alkylhydroperoxidase
MQLVPPLADAQASDAAKSLFQTIHAAFGAVPNIFRTMGHAPDVLQSTLGLNKAIQSSLDPKLRELAYLKTSMVNGCRYCLHYHRPGGKKAGLTDAQIEDLDRYETSPAYNDLERTVVRFADQWTRNGKAEAAVVQQLAKSLLPTQIIVLAASVGLANWTNRFNETFAIELP